MATTEDTDYGSIDQLADQLDLSGQPTAALKEEFETVDDIVAYVRDGGKFGDISGIGDRTSTPLWQWFKGEYPEANRERKEDDEAVCTEFTHDHGLDEDEKADPEKQYWAFVCPRCGDTNVLKGDPKQFRNRPFTCLGCIWVSLLDADSIDEWLESSVGNGGEN